tara:strand:- start:2547 stop:2756 length:210 start_codon:yes stop_codon:yes gene_type:complete
MRSNAENTTITGQELEDSIEEYIKNKRKEFYQEFGISIKIKSQVHKNKRHRPISSQSIPMEDGTQNKEV